MTQESSLPGEYDQVIFQRRASYRTRSKGRAIGISRAKLGAIYEIWKKVREIINLKRIYLNIS